MTKLIGTGNNQVSTNGMLGGMAFQSPEDVQVDKLQEQRYNVVTQQDIGTAPNQVPINGFLGSLAYLDSIQGIDFSPSTSTGTVTSNILDDYEEGTYSPAFQHATNVNYTSQNGQYIKIGRLVRVSGEFSFTTYTSFVNGWDQITLPFNGTRLNSSGSVSSDWWAVVAGGTGQSAGTLNFGPFGNPHNDTNLAFTNIFLTGNNGLGNASLGTIFTSSATTKTIRFHITYTATS